MNLKENRVILKVYRGTEGNQYWEEFVLHPSDTSYNLISAFMEIQRLPINRSGNKVEPIVWEQGCLEEVCGSCSVLVNGTPRQACTTLIREVSNKSGDPIIKVAPLTKFPLVRDLVVDRQIMFENLKKIKGWIEIDGSFERGYGVNQTRELQESRYLLSTCMTCGCCSEACPQVSSRSKFIGAAAVSQARLFNAHPLGKTGAAERLHFLMEEGGIGECGNAQNCAQVCPKQIPLTESIALIGRETVKQSFRSLFELPDTFF